MVAEFNQLLDISLQTEPLYGKRIFLSIIHGFVSETGCYKTHRTKITSGSLAAANWQRKQRVTHGANYIVLIK